MSRRQAEKNRRQSEADLDAMELRDSSTKERKRLRPLRQPIDNDLEVNRPPGTPETVDVMEEDPPSISLSNQSSTVEEDVEDRVLAAQRRVSEAQEQLRVAMMQRRGSDMTSGPDSSMATISSTPAVSEHSSVEIMPTFYSADPVPTDLPTNTPRPSVSDQDSVRSIVIVRDPITPPNLIMENRPEEWRALRNYEERSRANGTIISRRAFLGEGAFYGHWTRVQSARLSGVTLPTGMTDRAEGCLNGPVEEFYRFVASLHGSIVLTDVMTGAHALARSFQWYEWNLEEPSAFQRLVSHITAIDRSFLEVDQSTTTAYDTASGMVPSQTASGMMPSLPASGMVPSQPAVTAGPRLTRDDHRQVIAAMTSALSRTVSRRGPYLAGVLMGHGQVTSVHGWILVFEQEIRRIEAAEVLTKQVSGPPQVGEHGTPGVRRLQPAATALMATQSNDRPESDRPENDRPAKERSRYEPPSKERQSYGRPSNERRESEGDRRPKTHGYAYPATPFPPKAEDADVYCDRCGHRHMAWRGGSSKERICPYLYHRDINLSDRPWFDSEKGRAYAMSRNDKVRHYKLNLDWKLTRLMNTCSWIESLILQFFGRDEFHYVDVLE